MKSKMNSKLAGCLALVVGIWMSLSAMAQAAIVPYTDIPSIYSPWLTDQIAKLCRDGYLYVPRDKKFHGDDKLTRYDVAYVMGKVAQNLDGISSANVTFNDVPKSHWAYQRVGMAVKSGLMEGFKDGTFRGDQPVTRYEMAIILERALAKRNLSDYRDIEVSDVPKNHRAYKAVCSVCRKYIMTTHSKNDFRGDNYQTRYEAVQWLLSTIEALSE